MRMEILKRVLVGHTNVLTKRKPVGLKVSE